MAVDELGEGSRLGVSLVLKGWGEDCARERLVGLRLWGTQLDASSHLRTGFKEGSLQIECLIGGAELLSPATFGVQ